jgi:hypothetical protein
MSKSWKFERKGYKAKDSFFLTIGKKLCSMGSKCLTLGAGHMWEKILPKNMFGCPLKLILGFLMFLVINQNNDIQYEWMWKFTSVTRIIINWTIQFFSLKFVSNEFYLQKVAP